MSSYHRFYQQYFDILLNYKKLEFFTWKKKKKNSVNEIYSKESNNPLLRFRQQPDLPVILHYDPEQIYFIDWYYSYNYAYAFIHMHIYTNTHKHKHTIFCQPSWNLDVST